MPKVLYKRRDELEAELTELKSRKCETCKYFDAEFNCVYHLHPMMSFMSCPEWETVEGIKVIREKDKR